MLFIYIAIGFLSEAVSPPHILSKATVLTEPRNREEGKCHFDKTKCITQKHLKLVWQISKNVTLHEFLLFHPSNLPDYYLLSICHAHYFQILYVFTGFVPLQKASFRQV